MPPLRESIAARLFGDIIERRVREAAESDAGWHPLGGSGREVGYATHLDNIANSVEAYRSNPLAHRLIELTTDFVLGKGMRLVARDNALQAFVNDFWSHPLNRLATRQYEICTELSVSGEVFVTFHTNPYDGMSYLRLLPAQNIDRIETNPNDIEDELRFHHNAALTAVDGVTTPDAADLPVLGRWWNKSDCRHFVINRLVGSVRGQGDLVPMLPWLRRYKDWLTDRVRINRFKGAFLWDITLKGASKQALLSRQAELASPPQAGSVIVHNDMEEWKAVQPDIDAQAVEPDGKAMRLMIAAGAGVPLHFLAEGESATRSTAEEMGPPTYRHYERRQLFFGSLMTDLALEAARRSGAFASLPPDALAAEFEDITTTDNLKLAQALGLIVRAITRAVESGVLSRDEARQVLDKYSPQWQARAASTR